MQTSNEQPVGGAIVHLSDRIAVRALQRGDVASLSQNASNRNVWLSLRDRFPHPYTESDAQMWIEYNSNPVNFIRSGSWSRAGARGPLLPAHYAITMDNICVGGIGVDFGSDIYFRTGEIGYWLSEDHWGKGVMGRVVPAFVDWVWGTFDVLIRLNGSCNENNMGSSKCLEKAGFVFEGRREAMNCKCGQVQAELMYGALRQGWQRATQGDEL